MAGMVRAACLALALAAPATVLADEGPVRVGVLSDLSTMYTTSGGKGSLVAAELAVEDAGPVLGRPVEVIQSDHQNKPDVGAAIAKRWYDRDGVDMITDVPNSAIGFAVQAISAQYKRPLLTVATLSADFTGPRCTPYSAAWVMDTYSQANVLGRAVVRAGGSSWFIIGADYAFGQMLAKDVKGVVEGQGAKVLGQVFAPAGSPDFSSYLLQAQQSGAKIIGLANGAADTSNAIKQGREFGLDKSGQHFAAFVMFIHDIHALGLEAAQGLQFITPFYWNLDEGTRAFAQRFQAKMGSPPTWIHAGVYSATTHYLKAVKAAGTKDADAVMAKMRELPIEDFMASPARLRADGRVERPTYLFEVKKPSDSKGEWDLYRMVSKIDAAETVRKPAETGCPLFK